MKKFFTLTLVACAAIFSANAETKTDQMTFYNVTFANTEKSGYKDCTYTGDSGAEYALNAYWNTDLGYLQMRAQSSAGMVVTKSVGTVTNLTLKATNTSKSRSMEVYGSNTAYESTEDLWGSNPGTYLGTVDYSAEGTYSFDISGDYAYIGIKSAGSAQYFSAIEVAWNVETSGIESVSVNAEPVEYFNLQGLRVNEPTNGIFIRRQGSTVTKVAL